MLDFRRLHIPSTLRMAHGERMTFHDASYIEAMEEAVTQLFERGKYPKCSSAESHLGTATSPPNRHRLPS